MSLLMQALRKAESAKKSQAAEPAPEPAPAAAAPAPGGELTLESKEPTALDLAAASEEARAQAARVDAPPPPPAEPPVDYFSSETPPARTTYVAPEPAAGAPSQGFDPDRGFVAPAPPAPEPAPPAEPEALPPRTTAARLQVGLEQQKEAERAAQKTQEARAAAGAVFAAKARVRNRRPLIIAALGLLLLAAGAGYLYVQFARIGQSAPIATVVQAPAALPVPVPVPDPAPAPAMVATPVPVAVAASAAPLPAPALAPAAPAAATSAAFAKPARAARVARDRAVVLGPAAPRPPAAQASILAGAAAPIEVRRNDASRHLNPGLSSAYQAYLAGDSAAARSAYQRVLQQEPDNRDALLGMAAIAVNRGQAGEAGSFYTRLLELDPTDAEAASGLASVQRGDPSQAESNLKKVLAASPQTGSAHFALGNVYAQQARWPEAQQAYFQAVGATPANADYQFNLAVSLDKLGQKKLALDAYQRALQLAQRGGFNVNLATVQERIRQLRQESAAPPK